MDEQYFCFKADHEKLLSRSVCPFKDYSPLSQYSFFPHEGYLILSVQKLRYTYLRLLQTNWTDKKPPSAALHVKDVITQFLSIASQFVRWRSNVLRDYILDSFPCAVIYYIFQPARFCYIYVSHAFPYVLRAFPVSARYTTTNLKTILSWYKYLYTVIIFYTINSWLSAVTERSSRINHG